MPPDSVGPRSSRVLEQLRRTLSDSVDGSVESLDALPEVIGRFSVVDELGRGGMGVVLDAYDPELGRTVAVKVLAGGFLDENKAARFVSEAQVTAQIEHPNIIPIYDMGVTEDGRAYLVMKKVGGRSLHQVLERTRETGAHEAEWGPRRLLRAFVQVCNAVAFAHDRGVLHRDLKPENIMLGHFGEVLVLDWGVARLLERSTDIFAAIPPPGEGEDELPDWTAETLAGSSGGSIERVRVDATLAGALVGTPGYISPEQARGQLERMDARSDVWSLGAVLYELLTGQRAYHGNRAVEIIMQGMMGPPRDPRDVGREDGIRIPDEIAEICLRCLQPEPEDRFSDAKELADAVEAFLEGAKRRGLALEKHKEAMRRWEDHLELGREIERMRAAEAVLAEELPDHASLEDKAELWRLRRNLRRLEPRRAKVFSEFVGLCEKALAYDPDNPEARAALAQAYKDRLVESESMGDRVGAVLYAERLGAFDDGAFAAYLEGTGTLSLRTDPEGALVLCSRFDTDGLIYAPGPELELGCTPLERVPLEMGSYLLTLRCEGKRDTCYPVHIRRGGHWDSGPRPLRLFSDDQIGDGFVYVPAGPFIRGGDPLAAGSLERTEERVDGFFISEYPVTMGEYCAFINDLHRRNPEEAWQRVPRQEASKSGKNAGQYWERADIGDRYVVPELDRDGDRWDERWAVWAVNWFDAAAYAAWRSEADGVRMRLPLESEWEKAARGVDGRAFPWGDEFDPKLCRMRQSEDGRAAPDVVGLYEHDRSVYGVRDMAGSSREWCAEPEVDGDSDKRVIKGGSWNSAEGNCRCASHLVVAPWYVFTTLGFRLVKELPEEE